MTPGQSMRTRLLMPTAIAAAVVGLASAAPAAVKPKPNSSFEATVIYQGMAQYDLRFAVDDTGKHVKVTGTAWACASHEDTIHMPKAHVAKGRFTAKSAGYKVSGRFATRNRIEGHVHGQSTCAPRRPFSAD
jgi:hypothetical protein